MKRKRRISTTIIALIGSVAVILIMVLGTVFTGRRAVQDAEKAAHDVSLMYLDELASRREQVVENNLLTYRERMNDALRVLARMQEGGETSLEDFQADMKELFHLENFAFADEDRTIHTADGQSIDLRYDFDHPAETVSILSLPEGRKLVIIAAPVSSDLNLVQNGKRLIACFMGIDMKVMLAGLSMEPSDSSFYTGSAPTFCNIYTREGVPLGDLILGGLAVEDNLLDAMDHAVMDEGYSLDRMVDDFRSGRKGVASFTYGEHHETLSYTPVSGTDWMLTYLIRETMINEKISSVPGGIITRSIILSLLTALVLAGMFGFIIHQIRRNSRLVLEKETSEAENRARQEEMEARLQLQEQLLEQEKQRNRQEKLIHALSADYWSVYYLDLDRDEGVCYQSHGDLEDGLAVGERFPYLASFTAYANRYITEPYREEFMRFVQPDQVREGLKNEKVISYRYMVSRHGRESWEMVRFAGVRRPEDREDHIVHSVGACFTNVDAKTRRDFAQKEALSDALKAAEQASKAKTVFLSNMSHEIRTPMNAIIGLDSLALNEPNLSDRMRDYLEKIGSSANHLLTLINDILDMSRIESGRMTLKNEEFSFSKLISQISTIFSAQCADKKLDFQCEVIGQPEDYYIGDSMKLRQVLINILGNAVKFTPEGGSVCFNTECIGRFDRKSTLRFTIRDTGIGISEDYLPHIFDTFSQEDSSATNRYGSSGLGLAITKNIVEMMGGRIDVESQKGVGTVFTVTVTLADAEVRAAEEGGDINFRPGELNVLVIDDDPLACEHAKLVLEKAGIACETADSGARAVEMVKLRHARRDPYRLILVDWQMPEMDGIETTRRIRAAIGQESAIIILTAYQWDEVYDEAVSAGVDSFLPKPLFASSIIEEFREALARKNLLHPGPVRRADLKGRRILLAEDISVNAEIMVMVLQMREMEVDLAGNGRIAVEKFAASPEGYYDAILMDMRMPEMDGLEATARIRAMDRPDARSVPIIALTANAFDEDVQRSLQAGMNAHLSKPVEPAAIYETLESLIPVPESDAGSPAPQAKQNNT